MSAEMFRDLEYLIETQLAEITISNLRRCWRDDLSLEENLMAAASITSPQISEEFDRWMRSKCERM